MNLCTLATEPLATTTIKKMHVMQLKTKHIISLTIEVNIIRRVVLNFQLQTHEPKEKL